MDLAKSKISVQQEKAILEVLSQWDGDAPEYSVIRTDREHIILNVHGSRYVINTNGTFINYTVMFNICMEFIRTKWGVLTTADKVDILMGITKDKDIEYKASDAESVVLAILKSDSNDQLLLIEKVVLQISGKY